MKFYDNKRNLHDTCCGAVISNVKDTICKIFHIKNDISDDDSKLLKCNECKHCYDDIDSDHCYECIKGVKDNFEYAPQEE